VRGSKTPGVTRRFELASQACGDDFGVRVMGESAKVTDSGTLSERIPGRGGGGHWQAAQLTITDHHGGGTELTKDVGSEVRKKGDVKGQSCQAVLCVVECRNGKSEQPG